MAGISSQTVHPDNFTGLKCPPSTIICKEKTSILGDVTIGADCVIHPTASILAKNGPIVIGSNNLIEERVLIVNNQKETMLIGDNNVFEVDSSIESLKIGDNNIFECKSHTGTGIEITCNCIVGAGCRLERDRNNDSIDRFQPHTVITGQNLNRAIIENRPASSHSSQLDFLRKILPNYQKLWRPANIPATPPPKK